MSSTAVSDAQPGQGEALHVLQHSLGLDKFGEGRSYRNYFVTGEGSTDYPICMALVDLGLMTRTPGNEITGRDDFFRVTDDGKSWVAEHSPRPPKLTRSQRRYEAWLKADCAMRFGEWLKSRPTP